jgi:hypothetical protein
MENLDQHLEKALSFSQYQTTLNQQRRLLKEKFLADTLFAYNGGLFRITPEFLISVDTEVPWILDINSQPINIENYADFLENARTIYRSAIKEYGEAFQQLRRQRSVRALTDL